MSFDNHILLVPNQHEIQRNFWTYRIHFLSFLRRAFVTRDATFLVHDIDLSQVP